MRFLVISASRNISQAQEFNSTTLIVSIKKEHTHYWYSYYYYASIDSEMVILLLKFLSLKKSHFTSSKILHKQQWLK